MKLQTKFTFSLLVLACLITPVSLYFSYKTVDSEAEKSAFNTCFRILASVEASRAYVRDTLRPVIKDSIEKGDFLPEAMSASFVARKQFEHFLIEFPDYLIKFASSNPRNPINQADEIEIETLNRFSDNPELKEWRGRIIRDGKEYYTVAKPFRFKSNCMRCHSDPDIAPTSIVSRYGNQNGFWRKIGDITMYSISVPIEVKHANIKMHALTLFAPLIFIVVLILLISSQLFRQMVSRPIKVLTRGIDKLSKEDYQSKVDTQHSGELKVLAIAFNEMTEKLNESNKNKKYAENALHIANDRLEERVEKRTLELLTTNKELQQEIKQREKAESEVKVLSGLLPICSHCKKIRDDKGTWNNIDTYITKNSEATLSHSICQDCAKEHYPDYDVYAD